MTPALVEYARMFDRVTPALDVRPPEEVVWFDVSEAYFPGGSIPADVLDYMPFPVSGVVTDNRPVAPSVDVLIVDKTAPHPDVLRLHHDLGTMLGALVTFHTYLLGSNAQMYVQWWVYRAFDSGDLMAEPLSAYPAIPNWPPALREQLQQDFIRRMCAFTLLSPTTAAYSGARTRVSSVRKAMGRPGKIEWRTVVIEPRKPKTEHKGGTHASPRQHDRRGHWSTSKLGKRFWRPPCKVGKASNGTVFHDYVVKGPHAPTQTPPPDA